MATAYELAQQQAGLHERRDESALQDYLYNGGKNLSPATRAWCADFVNASLGKAGMPGTGSGAARSFLDYGQAVDKPEPGDIVVLSRGDPKGWQGHVGFYQGMNPDGSVRVLGGNQGDAVGTASYPADRVLGYRRPGEVSQDAEAQLGGFYGDQAPPASVAVASAQPKPITDAAASPSWSDNIGGFGKAAETAMRLVKGTSQQADSEPDPIKFIAPAQLRPVKMTEAPLPYVTRAYGGSIGDTGQNAPETPDALRAQQRQLIDGRRPAQMFPKGTQELPLPPFMERVVTERGVFHFDPMLISRNEIERASADGRENEILGLGPMSKDDVANVAARTGERPVAITERDPDGNEVKASVATPSTVEMQSDAILRNAGPRNSVDVEPVEDVVMARDAGDQAMGIARADGGSIDEYARGGGIGSGAIVGALTGATGGRADKIPGTAMPGSHVLPADLVSHMGQGNTNAGLKALSQMFKTGPYGTPLPRRHRADGGEIDQHIPVMLSDGEFVIPPEIVAEIGGGDVGMGHDVLDAWIMDERQKAIKTLAELPPPATD